MIASIVLASVLAVAQAATPSSAGQVNGQVVDGSNRGVAEARVTIVPTPMRGPMPGPPPQTSTDENGRYTFGGLAPGSYRVSAQKSGYAANLPGPGAPPPTIVTVAAGQSSVAPPVVLQRGGAIAGQVLDPSGQPLADARVMAMRQMPGSPQGNQAPLMPVGQSGQTNDLGEFRVFGLPPGQYFVQASPRPDIGPMGAAPAQARATILASTYFPATVDRGSAIPVTVGAGETSSGVSIQMIATAAFQISGDVVDESGAPVADAMVAVTPDRASGGGIPFGPPVRARTDAAGRFVASNIQSGTYILSAAAPVVTSGGAAPVGSGVGAGIGGGVSGGVTGIGATAGSFGTSSTGIIGGGFSMTEMRNGVTTTYRADPASSIRVVIADGNANNVQLVVKRP